MDVSFPRSSRTWSIYSRSEITDRYEVLGRIGSGTYSDVYRGRRLSDGLNVALKEIHDYQSSFREIEALQTLRDVPNVVDLIEYFWQEDDDAVLVLEYLYTDLAAVIHDGKKAEGLLAGEVKQWMLQILSGVDSCHRNSVIHRDLKPSNLLISAAGVLKLADFGQAIIIQNKNEDTFLDEEGMAIVGITSPSQEFRYYGEKTTCSSIALEVDDDSFKCLYSNEVALDQADDTSGDMTSCVGTRWFRAPELLYGSTNYGVEVDLWSVGCIFAELLTLEPLFPGTSDIDQISRIIAILGNINEVVYPGCSKLPDYCKIAFSKVESPIGLDVCLRGCHSFEVGLVKKLVCCNPNLRAAAIELLGDVFFKTEPFPLPINELKVPASRDGQDAESSVEWGDYWNVEYDSDDFDSFSRVNVINCEDGFTIKFA